MEYNFSNPVNFVKPNRWEHNKGMVVIVTDDGRMGDYSHWQPLFLRKSKEYNPWFPFNLKPKLNLAVNTDYNSGPIKFYDYEPITLKKMKEMHDKGFNIVSHGTTHAELATFTPSQPIEAGDEIIYIESTDAARFTSGYEYLIEENDTSEVFEVVERTYDDYIKIKENINNSYSTGATIQITHDSFISEMEDIKEDLKQEGIEKPINFVWPFNDNNENTRGWLLDYYNSGTSGGDTPITKSEVDFVELPRDNIAGYTKNDVDNLLDDITTNDSVAFLMGHGEIDQQTLNVLEYLIDECYKKKCLIATIQKAIEYLGWEK